MMAHYIKKSSLTTARWAGGTTTQIFIFPKESEYAKFNFRFRLSTATVEVESSNFTFMPGVTRHLIILDGKLQLFHPARYSLTLNAYDKDVFNGEWPTHAEGKVRDFNLMVREGAFGFCTPIILKQNEEIQQFFKADFSFFYCVKGSGEIQYLDQCVKISGGDTLIIENSDAVFTLLANNNQYFEIISGYIIK
jgi:environmental stress-induced protein Ves